MKTFNHRQGQENKMIFLYHYFQVGKTTYLHQVGKGAYLYAL